MKNIQRMPPAIALTSAQSNFGITKPLDPTIRRRTNRSKKHSSDLKQTTIALSPDLIEAVLSGKERATIRKGRREYPIGPAVFDSGIAKIQIEITAIEIKQFKDLTDDDGRVDGDISKDELKASLATYYPGIQDSDELTIIHFKLAN